MSSTNEKEVLGLKSEVKRQVGLKKWEESVGDYNQRCLVESWKLLLSVGMSDKVSEMIWEYIENNPSATWKPMKSGVFGIYSVIGEYENKKGHKSLAHFTENGHYIGSVKTLGDKPISYDGNFRITKERFVLDLSNLPDLTLFNGVYVLPNLFNPITAKKLIVEDDEDDIPIAELIKRRKN